ncbi:hypothetical protein VMCG_10900 [Cytospora schulzeri]|uniref:Uncharacterized protein n=1 Tax=Cytospora schulzeri TaxID=448051 RepID=A0A423V8B2_9PEZI|nr:hypothetical protein VMCG_10900 [Valsa malicola]
MSVYVVTGVSRGIGFEFLKQISADPQALFIGLVRNVAGTEKKVKAELGDRSNVHIVYADLTSHASLKQAAVDTAAVVGDRGVDYLIANAAYMSYFDGFDPIGALGNNPDELDKVAAAGFQANCVGNIHLFNNFIPLVKQGKVKKVIAITSGHADLDFINSLEVEVGALYAASKAALNVIVAKFNAQYKKEGVLFMSISPGVVDVGNLASVTPDQAQGLMGFLGKMAQYAPATFGEGKPNSSTPEESVKDVRATIERASIKSGFAGSFVSHWGTKQWV